MEVRIDGKRFAGVPDGLAPLLQAYAGLQGRSVTRAPDGALHVAGPLSGYRLVFSLDDRELRPLLLQTKALLEMLGARVVAGGEDVAAVVGLRSGDAAGVSPGSPFRGDDRVLARCLREGLQAQGERPVAETAAAGRPWKPPAGRAAALVTLSPDFPAVPGLAAGLLRFAGLSPAQVEALRLQDLLAHLPEPQARLPRRVRRTVAARAPGLAPGPAPGPEPMLLSRDGHWVSPRAHKLEERRCKT